MLTNPTARTISACNDENKVYIVSVFLTHFNRDKTFNWAFVYLTNKTTIQIKRCIHVGTSAVSKCNQVIMFKFKNIIKV